MSAAEDDRELRFGNGFTDARRDIFDNPLDPLSRVF